jgi:ferric-chelate reductase [NAD(P)H]
MQMLDLESLFNLSYGMCIVSSKKIDKINGCIVNTVFQITPEPAMIAVSVNRENLTYEYIAESRVFAVSILAEGTPLEFTGRFGFRSGRNMDKFQAVSCKIGITGAPIVLDNTVGFIEVEVTDAVDVETHTLFIGKIVACETIDDSKVPMTYTYYRDVKGGRTPRTAATYIKKKSKEKPALGD